MWIFVQGKELKAKKNKEAPGIVYEKSTHKPERPGGGNLGYIGFFQFGIVV